MSESGAGPSKRGYWVGGAIIVLAGIAAVVWFVVGFKSFSGHDQRLSAGAGQRRGRGRVR